MGQSLAGLTTMRVGGTPAALIACHAREELIANAQKLWATGENWAVLGGGSNIVFADEPQELHVLQVLTTGIEVLGDGHVRVQAGENWDAFVEHAIEMGWPGVESLSGIPGTVGASVIQNIGAYGQEVAAVVRQVEFLNYQTGELQILSKNECEFGYRDSVFKRGALGGSAANRGLTGIVTWVEFEFHPDLPAASTALMRNRRQEVLGQRAAKGMVLDAKDHDTWSCGSFFVNPFVTESFARTLPEDAPRWPDEHDPARVKLSAAWLIENAGVQKGFSLPGSHAAVSTKHALAITNRGEATAQQVLELASFIQVQVANRFGVQLTPEPNLIGFN